MSSLRKIYKGNNGTVEWPFNDNEGNPLNLDQMVTVTAQVIQKDRVVETYVMADGTEFRRKDVASDTVVFEYTTALTNTLAKMVTALRVTIVGPEIYLVVDDNRIWTKQEDIFEVV